MIFCGQCGQQLAPGSTRCPRCGAAVEETTTTSSASADEYSTDDATVASPSLLPRNSVVPNNSGNQQPLVLRQGADGNNFDGTLAYDPNAFNTRSAPNQNRQSYQAGYSQSGGQYPTQTANYPGYTAPGGYAGQQGAGYSGANPPMGYSQPGQYQPQQEAAAPNSGGRAVGIAIIVIGLLFILSAVVLFVIQQTSSQTGNTNTVTPLVTQAATQAPSTQQAQAIVQQYYDDVNKQDYQGAYNLWQAPPSSFDTFKAGYKNTKSSQISFDKTTVQQDGTVQITVTVNAVETASSGDRQSAYNGFYTVAQQKNDGSWKIMHGQLHKK